MRDSKQHECQSAHRIGIFLALLFTICFVWYYINPNAQEMHVEMFKVAYLGFSGMNVASFLLAVVQTYLWGYVFLGIWILSKYLSPSKK